MTEGGLCTVNSECDSVVLIQSAFEGGMVVLRDGSGPQAGGWLVLPADHVSPQAITFMACHGRGLVCLALTEERIRKLGLPLMPSSAGSSGRPVFTVSIEARQGVSTGISAADRAVTMAAAIRPDSGPEALVTPGHVFPMVADAGGLLSRSGIAEAAVDLARLAGLSPAAAVCDILDEDGDLARGVQLEAFAARHNLPIADYACLVSRLLQSRPRLREKTQTVVRDSSGTAWRMVVFADQHKDAEHVALVLGSPAGTPPPPHVVLNSALTPVLQPAEGQDAAEAVAALRQVGRGVVLHTYAASGESILARLGAEMPRAAHCPSSSDSHFLVQEMLRHLGVLVAPDVNGAS